LVLLPSTSFSYSGDILEVAVNSLLRHHVSNSTLSTMIEEGVRTVKQEDCTYYVMIVTRKLPDAASGQHMPS